MRLLPAGLPLPQRALPQIHGARELGPPDNRGRTGLSHPRRRNEERSLPHDRSSHTIRDCRSRLPASAAAQGTARADPDGRTCACRGRLTSYRCRRCHRCCSACRGNDSGACPRIGCPGTVARRSPSDASRGPATSGRSRESASATHRVHLRRPAVVGFLRHHVDDPVGDVAAAAVSKANIREILVSSQLTLDSFLGCQAEDWYTLIAAHASDAYCDSILEAVSEILLQEQHESTSARVPEQDESTCASCSTTPSPSLSDAVPVPSPATASAQSSVVPKQLASGHPSNTPHEPASHRSPSDDVPVLTSRLQLTEEQMRIYGSMVEGGVHARDVSSALLEQYDAAAAAAAAVVVSGEEVGALRHGGEAPQQHGSEVGASAAACQRLWKRAAAAACFLLLLLLLRRCGMRRLRMRGLLDALKFRLKHLY